MPGGPQCHQGGSISPLTQTDTFLSLWSVPCEAGCWVRNNLGATSRNYSLELSRVARSSPGPWGTLCHPGSAGCTPVLLSPRPLVPARRGRAEHPPPPPRCLPPSAGSGTPGAPRCRSRLPELRGLCSLSPEAARSPAPFSPLTRLWVKCGILLPQFPSVPCVALSSLLQHGLERNGLAFPLLCSEAQSSVQAPTDRLPLVPRGPSVQCHGPSAEHPLALVKHSVLCGRATVLILPDSLLVYPEPLTS